MFSLQLANPIQRQILAIMGIGKSSSSHRVFLSLSINNHPILDASLFPQFPQENHLCTVREKLDMIDSGSHLANQTPAVLNNDGRSATIIVTLPVRFRGGIILVCDSLGREEKFQGSGGQARDIDWLAIPADSEYRIDGAVQPFPTLGGKKGVAHTESELLNVSSLAIIMLLIHETIPF